MTAMHRNQLEPVIVPLVSALLLTLVGCAAAPGMRAPGSSGQSSVEMPVRKNDEIVAEKVDIQAITAELIIAKEKENRPAAPEKKKLPPYEYRLGPGDIISIIVWDHPELTIPAGSYRTAEQAGTVVNEDGSIYYPYAGVIQVEGKTLPEVRDILTRRIAKYIENVQLDVRIAAFRSKRVYVVGEVNQPGIQEITDIPPTIVEMINRAGGFSDEADRRHITLTRDAVTYRVDLLSLYEQGNISQNILLEPGDVVNVPDRQFDKIFVLGEVRQPGSILMNKGRKSLAEALGDAGDINATTADPQQIFVLRGGTATPEIYHLDSRSPDALLLADRFPLHPRDVVYVDTAEIVRWNRVISNVAPTINMLQSASGTSFPLFKGK